MKIYDIILGLLKDYWILYPDGKCGDVVEKEWARIGASTRKNARIVGEFEKALFSNSKSKSAIEHSSLNCPAVCLSKGTPLDLLLTPVEYLIYSGKRDSLKFKSYNNEIEDYILDESDNEMSLMEWMHDGCQRVEMGWVSYHPNPVSMFWKAPDGRKISVGELEYGEKKTIWQTTTLGHVFELEDSLTKEPLGDYIIQHEGFKVIGDSGTRVGTNTTDPTHEIQETLNAEWDRAHRVKRTFTELGFSKGRVPDDLWSSIISYYNNNAEMYAREEWDKKGVHVNWWEVDAFMIGMPWRLKRYWQTRLMKLVELWTGATLENTDIYGMRRYEHGARLLTHVDREQTHATSMIINIAQGGIREPWSIEIYDFAGRLHEIIMEPGDIVYYESARCLHGRMMPLNGSYYVNLFTHYRPVGDPKWFTKENPDDGAKQLIDVGECTLDENDTPTCSSGVELPTLSPQLETLTGPLDLFKYWEKTSLKQDPMIRNKAAQTFSRHEEF